MIVDWQCGANGGEAVEGADADGVAWVTAAEIDDYGINAHAKAVILRGLNYHQQA